MRKDVLPALCRRPAVHALACRLRDDCLSVERNRRRRVRFAVPQVAEGDVFRVVGIDYYAFPGTCINRHLAACGGRESGDQGNCRRQRFADRLTVLGRLVRKDVGSVFLRRPAVHAFFCRVRDDDLAVERNRRRRVRIAVPQIAVGDVFSVDDLDYAFPGARIDRHPTARGGREGGNKGNRRRQRLADLRMAIGRRMCKDVGSVSLRRPAVHALFRRTIYDDRAVERDRRCRIRLALPQVAVGDAFGTVGLDRAFPGARIDHHPPARGGRVAGRALRHPEPRPERNA